MSKYQRIFDRHYFSNHYIESNKVEAQLKETYSKKHAVIFANFLLLTMAAKDELNADIAIDMQTEFIKKVNSILKTMGRRPVRKKTINDDENFRKLVQPLKRAPKALSGYLYVDDEPNSLIISKNLSGLITNITALITDDNLVAEKIRWARASYGRQGRATIKLKSNGRVSELHALEMNSFLENHETF